MTAKSVTITVAIIGAVATLGAAVLSNLHESKAPPPTIQQTASGAGSINVGRDAVITTNNIKSAGEEAAERVQACEAQHGMKTASEKTESTETIPARNGEPETFIEHTAFRSCVWPRSQYADGDGYLEIKVQSVDGPGESEASGTNRADRITAPCRQLMVAYQFEHMGAYENESPITITADTLVTSDGKSWKNENGALPFYPDAGDFVVLRNDNHVIQSARCL
jgi:hypothetical protein